MSVKTLREKIMNRLWEYLKVYFYEQRVADSPIVQNLNFSHASDQKKAVLCYLTYSHFKNWESISSGRSQPFEILSIVRILSELGYCIDIIGCNDLNALPHIRTKRYDLVFGFGEAFYHLTQQQPYATSVLYMTEQHPEFSYKEEQKRVDYFNKRHNKQLKVSRSGKFYQLHHLHRVYSYVIVMGEPEAFLKQYPHPFPIFPTGLLHPGYTFKTKPYDQSRKHFLWLGSPGAAIHKGLDLLLDILAKRDDMVLHIGGLGEQDRKVLDLPTKQNIIDHGFINIKSDLFLELVNQCAYIILPSCSEACATSIATGMLHGLIPVVMKDAGFNRLGPHAIFLHDFSLNYLEGRLEELTNYTSLELEAMSRKAYVFARANFTIAAFEQSISQILNSITATHDNSNTMPNQVHLVG